MKSKVEYEYKKINTRDLCVDDLYQRKVDESRVARIAKAFKEPLVNAIKVSYRDGKYWIFDGQHTVEVLKYRNHGLDLPVECKVFYGLTWLDECELFILQNGISRSVNMNDRFKARYNSGDKDVIKMVELAQDVGVLVNFSGAKGRNKIVALTTLSRIYNNLTNDEYTELLSLIRDTWGGADDSWSAEILKGMYIFYETYKKDFKKKQFIERVGRVSPTTIIREGKVSSASGANKYARQILGAYNARARIRLPDLL